VRALLRKPLGRVALVLVTLAAISLVAFFRSPDLRWRVQVVGGKLSGELHEIPMLQMLQWLVKGSPVYLGGLAFTASPNAMVRNLMADSPQAATEGAAIFQQRCAHCHGSDARGGSGPNLLTYVATGTDWGFLSTVKWGRQGTAMAAQPVEDADVWRVHAFVRAQVRTWAAEAAARGAEQAPPGVSAEQLLATEKHPEDWLTYNGNLAGHRYSLLKQIDAHNVSKLRVAWVSQLRPSTKPLSATPIVVGGVMFVTEAPDGVVALDALSGRTLWRFRRPIDPSKLPLCCGAFNRGVAVLGNRVFVATLDAALVALDSATGSRIWEVQVAPPAEGFSMTSAPLVVNDQVVVGVAGGEFGTRGFVASFSAADGKRNWQFDVVPGKGAAGNDTWAGESWKTGGGSTWSTGAYDKQLDLIYWTTGNPWPPLDGSVRRGDNLYTNSVVALDRRTGKLKWHYQFTPSDVHDWDAAQQPILADVNWKGQATPALLLANRNAFYYVLDRRDGRFLSATPFVKQTWNKGFDANGRPTRDPEADPSREGTLTWPWMHGGTNWWPPSYDAQRKLHFVPTVDAATLYLSAHTEYTAGKMTMGGTTRLASGQPAVMAIKAIDPESGTVRWSTRLDRGDFHQYSRICGLLSTAGNVVFGGFEERLVALDSNNGGVLWQFSPGGLTNAAPVTYQVQGRQYVSVIAGNALFAFALPE
jgi:alcohol dehydrogenase (cytochrome c)